MGQRLSQQHYCLLILDFSLHLFQPDFIFVAVKNEPGHISSQIKNLPAHLGSGGFQSQVLNKQVLRTYHVPDCVPFVRDAE